MFSRSNTEIVWRMYHILLNRSHGFCLFSYVFLKKSAVSIYCILFKNFVLSSSFFIVFPFGTPIRIFRHSSGSTSRQLWWGQWWYDNDWIQNWSHLTTTRRGYNRYCYSITNITTYFCDSLSLKLFVLLMLFFSFVCLSPISIPFKN